jgi:hypothetical protein
MATPAIFPPKTSSNLLDTNHFTSMAGNDVQGGHEINLAMEEHVQVVDENQQFKCVVSYLLRYSLRDTY